MRTIVPSLIEVTDEGRKLQEKLKKINPKGSIY
jgi:hypothetical protein